MLRQRLSRKGADHATITPQGGARLDASFYCSGGPRRGLVAGKSSTSASPAYFFGPTELAPGTMVEVLLSPAVQVGTLTIGKRSARQKW
jgi:hypothetical protein